MLRFRSERHDLAACLRLAEHLDLHEGVCNHFSYQVSGEREGSEELYLINPFGLHWSEIKPESLILIDGDGTTLEGQGEAEVSARNIHISGHRANTRHKCLLHTHMPYATALTMLKGGRLKMAHQNACRYFGRVAYEENFAGLAGSQEEGDRLAQQAKNNNSIDITFLANHGVVVGAPTVAQAFDDLYYLERACRQQVLAQSTGQPLNIIPDDIARKTAQQFSDASLLYANVHLDALKRIIGMEEQPAEGE